MNIASLRSNADQSAQSAEIRLTKIALVNVSHWVVMWTLDATIILGHQPNLYPKYRLVNM